MKNIRYDLINIEHTSKTCECASKHVPKPVVMAVMEDGTVLCPTGITNLTRLLHEYALTGAVPDGSLTKNYGKHIRDLAQRIFEGRLQDGDDSA